MRVRRNPSIASSTRKITSAIVPAAIGAGGALAVNYAWNKWAVSMLPASLQTGFMSAAAQIALSMGMGVLAGMAFGKSVGNEVAAGAITVTVFNLASSYASGMGGALGTSAGTSSIPSSYYLGAGAYGAGAGSYGGAGSYSLAGLGVRMRQRRMGRYVGRQMNGNLPRGLNRYVGRQMAGNVPPGLNGLGVRAPMPRGGVRHGMGMGYIGPARIAGR